jgi:hypothetical protein
MCRNRDELDLDVGNVNAGVKMISDASSSDTTPA